MNQADLLKELKQVPELHAVPDAQFLWLAEKGTVNQYPDGSAVFKNGDPIDGFQILLSGEVALYVVQAGQRRNLGGNYEKYDIMGRLPYSRMKAAAAEGFAVGDVTLFFLHRNLFPEMVSTCYELTEALVHNMTDRVRDFTKYQQQNEKMMALGKLSAGLAHELNNPSAAVVRSAQELRKHLGNVPDKFKRVMKIQATSEIVDKVNELVFAKLSRQDKMLSLMEKSAREDELTDWLEQHDVPDGYHLAETLVEYGFETQDLAQIDGWIRAEDRAAVIGWVHQVLTTEKLVGEIEEAAQRINTLVTSVKGYTHMDRSPEKHSTDIHIGIRNTLTMLNHKIKKNNIRLVENYDNTLPAAKIFVSEMNQVWTNLIDNAVDAMEGKPDSELEIKTRKDREFVLVSVIDNGAGIPKEVVDKIFDPFFTTKAIGKGTGLGLEVVQRIVNQHKGRVDVFTQPGRTEFRVCFPLE